MTGRYISVATHMAVFECVCTHKFFSSSGRLRMYETLQWGLLLLAASWREGSSH